MYLSKVISNVVKRGGLLASIVSKRQQELYLRFAEDSEFSSNVSLRVLQYSSQCPPKCWNCDYVYKSELFCSKCKVLQELPENLNYFDIIGVKQDYNIQINEIHDKYRQLQKMLHPDKFGNKSEKEKDISEKFSSLVNKAYSTLADPLKRGIYMLQLNNISIPEGTTNLDPEFLMEIMEKNEEIEEASSNREKAIKLMEENKQKLLLLSKEAADAFHEKDLEKAKHILIRMKYYVSIDNRLKKLKEDLGIVK